MKSIFSLFLTFFLVACNDRSFQPPKMSKKMINGGYRDSTLNHQKLVMSQDSVFSNDDSYYQDSLFRLHNKLLAYYFKKYNSNSCEPIAYLKKDLKEEYLGFKNLGDINHNHRKDSVFVLNPLTLCEEKNGQSYYFTDTTLPRLQTDSYCCHPSSIFSVDDIDEDGIDEIGQYYSSCVSRYKSLIVYSLKKGEWKQVGQCIFDLHYSEFETNYKSYVRKLKKNSFAMLEITDLTDKAYVGKKHWVTFKV